jgi:rubrerythrin
MEAVCYTLEAGLEKAIEQERNSFETYRQALRIIKDRHARVVLEELASEELEHMHILQKALIGETVALHDKGESTGPPMNLTYFLADKPLDPNSSPQDVMVYAIHDEKRSVDFYQKMATQCAGAPMEDIFSKLYQEEKIHLARLEEAYEKLYLNQM